MKDNYVYILIGDGNCADCYRPLKAFHSYDDAVYYIETIDAKIDYQDESKTICLTAESTRDVEPEGIQKFEYLELFKTELIGALDLSQKRIDEIMECVDELAGSLRQELQEL